MAIRLTKTSKILFAILIFVLSLALGFLVWRINQESNLDPTDSDAGGGNAQQCQYDSCSCNVCQLPNGTYSALMTSTECSNRGGTIVSNCTVYNEYRDPDCFRVQCSDGAWILTTNKDHEAACIACNHVGDPEEEGGECNLGSECAPCPWPKVAYCGDKKCSCILPNEIPSNQIQCGSITACSPADCPTGMVDCGTSADSKDKTGCSPETSCVTACTICNNKSTVSRYCKPAPANTCDGGSWVTKPTGNINYEDSITFTAKAKDADGIKKDSIVVKKGTQTLPVCSTGQTVDCIKLTEAATETTITGTLSTENSKLDPGDYTISMNWKDKKDATSAACALTTSFTVLPAQTNPDWDISKSVVEQCIDDSTEDPKAELTYTITVKNTGDGAGTISKIEDELDSKVVDAFIQTSTITSPGQYSDGKIVWNYTSSPLSLAAGATKTYTYKLLLDKDSFDTYSNSVTLTPVGSDAIVATANITADCVITEPPVIVEPPIEGKVPQTGIFDSTASRIVAGFVLLTFGAVIYNLPNSTFTVYKKGKSYKYRDRFEKRVANR